MIRSTTLKQTLVALLTLSCFITGTLFAANEGPSMNDLFKPDDVSWVGMSPDGEHLAMIRGRDRGDTLVLVKRPIDSQSIVNGVESANGQRFTSANWVGPDQVLIEASDPKSGELTGNIYLLGIDGTRRQLIEGGLAATQLQTALVSVLSDDPDSVLLAVAAECSGCDNKPLQLIAVNLHTGEQTLFAPAPPIPAYFVADANGSTVFAAGRSNADRVEVYQWSEGHWNLVTGFEPAVESGVVSYFIDSKKQIYGLGNHLGTADLVRWQPHNDTIERIYNDGGSDVDADIRSSNNDRLLAVRTNPGFSQWHYLEEDSAFKNTHKSLQAAFPDSDIEVTSMTDDLSEAVVRVRSARNVGDYYAVNVSTKKYKLLARSRPWLAPITLRNTQSIELVARDGLALRGYLTLPDSIGPYPLVVWIHDQPNSTTLSGGFASHIQVLALNGYAVLQVNYRGMRGLGQQHLIPFDDPNAQTIQRDIADATRWTIERNIALPDRVCVLGEGYGGFAAVKAMTVNSTLYQCAVGIDGFYDVTAPFDWNEPILLSPQSILHQNSNLDTNDGRRSPLNRASNISGSVLLIGSSEQTYAMKEQLNTLGKSVELVEVLPELERFEQTVAYLDRHLLVGKKASAEAPSFGSELTTGQVQSYQAIVTKMRTEISKIAELRLSSAAAVKRRARKIINSHDADVRNIVSDEQWALYVESKQELESQLLAEVDFVRIR